jgi:GPI mannosyltransferase 3
LNKEKNRIILVGFIFHLLAAIFSIGYHHCDELFQVFEYAGYKLGLNSAASLPWEFHEQMRSGLQPLIVYSFTRLCHSVQIADPFTIAMLLRILQSAVSFAATVLLLKRLESEIQPGLNKWHWFAGLLFWCLPYFHARISSENVAGTFFLFSLVLVTGKIIPGRFLLAGVLSGLAFITRFQLGFMVVGMIAWLLFIEKISIKMAAILMLGFLAAIVIGLLCDKWLYGNWVISWWNYLDLNLFQNKASQFGKEPFYFYVEQALLQLIPPFSILIVASVILFWIRFRLHLITWITLPFVLLHFVVAHKELRFLFPVLNFLPFMFISCIQSLSSERRQRLAKKWLISLAVVVNAIALLIFAMKPADNISFSLKKIYDCATGQNPVLLYEHNDPYNKMAALNFFRYPGLKTSMAKDTEITGSNTYYFSERFNDPPLIVVNKKTFIKIYSSYPQWFVYLDFNGWLERSFHFSIYRLASDHS